MTVDSTAEPSTGRKTHTAKAHLSLWRSLLRFANLPALRMAVVIGTAILAAMSEFLSIALIQPVLVLFSGQEQIAQLDGYQSSIVTWLEGMNSTDRILVLVAMLIILQVLREALLFLSELVSILIRNAFELQIRKQVYANCLNLPMSAYKKTVSGEIHNTINSYPRSAAGYVFSMLSMIPQIVMLSVYVAMMFLLDWRLMVVVGVVAALILSGMRIAYAKQMIYGRRMRDALSETASKANELIRALPVIRSFGQESRMERGYAKIAQNYLGASASSSILNAAIGPLQRVLSFITILVSISIFYLLTGGGEQLFLSTLVVFMIILARVNGPLTALNLQRAGLSNLYPFVDRLVEFLSHHREWSSDGDQQPGPLENIVFDDVRFEYGADTAVLHGIDLTIGKGEFVALVGPSGAGKTTVAALVSGFEKPTGGQIRVNDIDLQAMDRKAWRQRVALVPQAPYMFDTSVFENIRFGKPDAERHEVEHVAQLANADEFIAELPDAYETQTGEGGDLLSGGQIQRLALARALITKPDLLILDEATSAQDTNSEERIRQTLENLRGTVGLLVIAHRLSTIRNADKIIVLDDGHIAEYGPHDELMTRQGLYFNLYQNSLNETGSAVADDLHPLSVGHGE